MAVATTMRGEFGMAYETKVLLMAIAQIVQKADSLKEVYEAIEKMANVEGVVLDPYSGKEKKRTFEGIS